MPYVAGSLVQISCSFIDLNTGAMADPTVVVVKVQVNGGSVTTYTYGVDAQVVRDSQGEYHAELDTTAEEGIWAYEWIGTGAVQAIAGNSFLVTTPLI